MLFSYKSSLLVAVLTLGSALVRAQFQGGYVKIRNSEGQDVFAADEDGAPVGASKTPPEGSGSTWNITATRIGGDEYLIRDMLAGRGLTGFEDTALVTIADFTVETWTLKSLPSGSYLIQKAGTNLAWNNIPQDHEHKTQAIFLERGDDSSVQQFTFVDTNGEN